MFMYNHDMPWHCSNYKTIVHVIFVIKNCDFMIKMCASMKPPICKHTVKNHIFYSQGSSPGSRRWQPPEKCYVYCSDHGDEEPERSSAAPTELHRQYLRDPEPGRIHLTNPGNWSGHQCKCSSLAHYYFSLLTSIIMKIFCYVVGRDFSVFWGVFRLRTIHYHTAWWISLTLDQPSLENTMKSIQVLDGSMSRSLLL